MGEMRNASTILVIKPKGHLGNPRRRWKDTLNLILKNVDSSKMAKDLAH
jgi:hypothetical protein